MTEWRIVNGMRKRSPLIRPSRASSTTEEQRQQQQQQQLDNSGETSIKWFSIVGFLDMFAVSLVVPALSMYGKSLGMTNTSIGVLISVYGGLQCISSPFIGYWSDIQGRKCAVVYSLFLTAVSYFILGLSTLHGGLILFIIGRIVAGLFKHSQTLIRAYFAAIMSKERGAVAFSRVTATANVGFIVGPIVGGRLAESENAFIFVCLQATLLFLINAVIVLKFIPSTMKEERQQLTSPATSPPTVHAQSSSAYSEPTESSRSRDNNDGYLHLWDILLLRFLVGFTFLVYRETFLIVLSERYYLGSTKSGYIMSYQAFINVISGFLVAPLLLHVCLATLSFSCSAIMCMTLISISFANDLWWSLILLVPLIFSHVILRSCVTELLVFLSKPGQAGTVVGVGQSIVSLSRMLASVSSGYLLDQNDSAPIIAATMCAMCTVLLSVWIMSRFDNRNRPGIVNAPSEPGSTFY